MPWDNASRDYSPKDLEKTSHGKLQQIKTSPEDVIALDISLQTSYQQGQYR